MSSDPTEMMKELSNEIDASILEESIGGQDSRPFVSSDYLNEDFDRDYLYALNKKK